MGMRGTGRNSETPEAGDPTPAGEGQPDLTLEKPNRGNGRDGTAEEWHEAVGVGSDGDPGYIPVRIGHSATGTVS